MQDKGRNCVRKGGLPTRNLRQGLVSGTDGRDGKRVVCTFEAAHRVHSGRLHHNQAAGILKACIIKQEKNSWSKAIQTCASHLIIYILFEISILIIIITYRLQEISPNAKKFWAIFFIIVPPTVNPIIYGIATKDIRTNIVKFFKSTISPK
ncbi:olfactory receptor 52N5-like [Anguilla anguilla]|uniref:olfactory receptor 52N5-like n=1 Tax=Anguilla anguilla TaxID=7936 RepID=UPI0015AA8209|nr:olfactory receptor 52N5-like [Anguilla anguilla]